MKRYIENKIKEDLKKKMVFVGGPRQVGKTTTAKSILGDHNKENYLNWDNDEDRERIMRRELPAGRCSIVFDEIHKYDKWRNFLKGIYDKRKDEISILVTGSAKLDYYRRGGDSLQGRYFFYQMHPLSVAELKITSQGDFNSLLELSGFPEPFLSGNEAEKKRWSLQYRSRLVREDLADLERVNEISLIERLAMRLPDLVASPLSLNALREDLQISHATVARWIEILERLYYLFRIYPFGSPKIRAVKKEAKHYHYDWSLVKEKGARLENLVASHLLKWCHWELDTKGRELELRYFRDIDRREVDFVILEEGKPIRFIECKSSTKSFDRSINYLKQRFPHVEAIQLTTEERTNYQNEHGVKMLSLINFLSELI